MPEEVYQNPSSITARAASSPMIIGRVRHRITIEAPAESQAADGSIVQAWSTFVGVWASVEPLTGKEYFSAQREQASTSHRIRMRHLDGVSHRMRIAWGGRIFQIESVANVDERGRELVLMCRESM
jgi:SPP1 family predicted phage head-tail adaptor